MGFQEAVRTVFSKYAMFTGNAVRSEYWWWTLFAFVLLFITGIIDGAVISPMLGFEAFEEKGGQPLSIIVSLGLIIPSIAVGVRRLHDIGRSGWWLLIGLVPFLGAIVLIYWFVQPTMSE